MAAVGLEIWSPYASVNIFDGVLQVDEEWLPSTGEGDKIIEEAIPLIALGEGALIASELRNLNQLLRRAVLFVSDESYKEYVVLRLTHEGGTIQDSLIYGGRLVKGLLPGVTFASTTGTIPYTLTIRRHPAWESPTATTFTPASVLVSYGGTEVLTGVDGDMLARPHRISLNAGGSPDANFKINDLWIGIKSMPFFQEGSESDFNPLVPMATGATLLNGTVKLTAATRSSAEELRTSFATDATLVERATNNLEGSANLGIYAGRYLVLAAAKVASGTVAGIQLRMGYFNMGYSEFIPYPEVIVDSTTYKIVPLGYVQLPPFFPSLDEPSNFPSANLLFGVWAERLSGSGDMFWDDLVLIPQDHAVSLNGIAGPSNSTPINIHSRRDDKFFQYGGSYILPDIPGAMAVKDFGVPPRNSIMVIAADADGYSEDIVNDKVNFVLAQYYTRWRNYIP